MAKKASVVSSFSPLKENFPGAKDTDRRLIQPEEILNMRVLARNQMVLIFLNKSLNFLLFGTKGDTFHTPYCTIKWKSLKS